MKYLSLKSLLLSLVLISVVSISASAWVFQPQPRLYYPEFGDIGFMTDGQGWAQWSKYTRAYGNDEISMGLEAGYQSTLFRSPYVNVVLDLRLNLINDFNSRSDWYFSPRAIITDVNFSLFVPAGKYLAISAYYHHDCKHDVDSHNYVGSERLSVHDWLGVSLHMKEMKWDWMDGLDTTLQAELGANLFIQQLYDYLDADHQTGRIVNILSSDLIRWQETYSLFLQTQTELFFSDPNNQFHGENVAYVDFMAKTGFRYNSPSNRMVSIFAQWDYINDNLLTAAWEPGWLFSFGFSISG